MKVSVLGTGYVGLVTGVCLADKGHQVVCVDIDPSKVERINNGISPIYENGLDELLKRNVHDRLRATTDLEHAILNTDLSLIAVGTPFDGTKIDLTYIKEVTRQIGRILKSRTAYHVVVIKSTVVPGTTDEVVLPILEEESGKKAGTDFGVGMNPEFLTEGEAVHDFMCPDRIVLGGIDEATIQAMDQLYANFAGVERLRTNNRTAEMIKYTSNAMLAMLISFSNEMANFCSAIGDVDIVDVMKGVHSSRYLRVQLPTGEFVSPPVVSFLHAGCGFGGSCFPKDVKALVAHGERVGAPLRVLDAVLGVNAKQPDRMITLLRKYFPSLKGVSVSVLGLAFRPDTNDMRESPAIPIIERLIEQGAVLKAYDPAANHEARKLFAPDKLALCENLSEAIKDVQAIILVTRWEQFKALPDLLRQNCVQPLVIDGRRFLDKQLFDKYEGIGLSQ